MPELKLTKVVVSEAGASVYSASALRVARSCPTWTYRCAARSRSRAACRTRWPSWSRSTRSRSASASTSTTSTESKLARSLDAVVEDCVNAVGVDVNTASAPLLARVSGLGAGAGRRTSSRTATRTAPFRTRKALKKVPRLGAEGLRAGAGFLRITDGDDPLDASGVHPEAYPVVRADRRSRPSSDIKALIGNARVAAGAASPQSFVDETFGLPTVTDILAELEKPGRDPRPEFKTATLQGGRREDRATCKPGMMLEGVGHQRRGLRRLRRHRRAPGRPGAHLGAVGQLRQGPARGGEARRHRQGEGAGGRHRRASASR